MAEPSRGHLHHVELVCPFCPYEVSVSNPIRSAFLRATPDECPNCGADLEEPGGVAADETHAKHANRDANDANGGDA